MEHSPLLIALFTITIVTISISVIAGEIKHKANKYPPAAPERSKAAGVGGWLLFLIFDLMFAWPVINIVTSVNSFTYAEHKYPFLKTLPDWSTFKLVIMVTILLEWCLSYYAGAGLARGRNSQVVDRAKVIIWVIGPGSVIALALTEGLVFGTARLALGNAIVPVISTSIWAAIWNVYLSHSRRVEATYDIT